MADKKPNQHDAAKGKGASGGRRFRLTDIFADSATPSRGSETETDIRKRANALGVKLPPAVNADVIATANRVYDTSPRATVLRDGETTVKAVDEISYIDSLPSVEQLEESIPQHDAANNERAVQEQAEYNADLARRQALMNGVPTGDIGSVYTEIEQLREGMEEMYRVMIDMQERGDAQDKVFNTLHSELQDYKNDFIYEHLKPVVRPLLFLFDHMEQFDNELASQRSLTEPESGERRLLSPVLVRENIAFFREQLVEALRICEVTPMKRAEGEIDVRLHKVIETVAVDKAEHNTIQRTLRSGWYLNGRVFRPAEVVVGVNKELAASRPLVTSTRSATR